MGDDKEFRSYYDADPETGEAVFAGTTVFVRDFFSAIATGESIDAFCGRTGVDRIEARKTMDFAAGNIPKALLDLEKWRAHFDELTQSFEREKHWTDSRFFKFVIDRAFPVITVLILLAFIVLFVLVSMGIIKRIQNPKKSAITRPESIRTEMVHLERRALPTSFLS